jgi:hypothetical protein
MEKPFTMAAVVIFAIEARRIAANIAKLPTYIAATSTKGGSVSLNRPPFLVDGTVIVRCEVGSEDPRFDYTSKTTNLSKSSEIAR